MVGSGLTIAYWEVSKDFPAPEPEDPRPVLAGVTRVGARTAAGAGLTAGAGVGVGVGLVGATGARTICGVAGVRLAGGVAATGGPATAAARAIPLAGPAVAGTGVRRGVGATAIAIGGAPPSCSGIEVSGEEMGSPARAPSDGAPPGLAA